MATLRHVGIIPDGTRRWAKQHGEDLESAYVRALTTLCRHVHSCYRHGAKDVSIYLLSSYNLRRTEDDLGPYSKAGVTFFRSLLPDLLEDSGATALLAGDIRLLPERFREPAKSALESGGRTERRLFLCAPYDPVAELRAAALKWRSDREERPIEDYLWVPSELDLVVRTGGARTLSNFLPLQCGYAQIIFLKRLFNELSTEAFDGILRDHLDKEVKRGT